MKRLTDIIREALELATDGPIVDRDGLMREALTALSELERMAVEQEPVARVDGEGQVAWFAPIPEDGANLYATPPAQQPHDHVAVTWDAARTRILAVTLQDAEGRVLCVIDEAPAQQQQYEAGDMASAHNDGFRAGVASVAQQPQEIEVVCPVCSHTFYAWPGEHKVQQPQAEAVPEMHDALCPALTGGDCTCTPPATIDKVWAQFCGGIGRGPDAPYPGMIEAFESHYGQTFTDKDWREETGVWAAAWKAAKAHGEAAPQQAETVPSDVVRDAERYRWLRNESWAGYNTGKGTPSVYTVDGAGNRRMMLAEEAMDAAIDAAIAAQGEKP